MEKSEIETIYRKYFHDVFLDLMRLSEAGVYTLKRKCMMSPSCTTYSLPST